jgi:hypothetical protein
MSARLPILIVLLLALGPAAPTCTHVTLFVLSPLHDAVIGTFVFPIEIQVTGDFDPGTLQAALNGKAMTLVDQGSGIFRVELNPGAAAMANPGPPLRDNNTLTASVEPMGGGQLRHMTIEFQYLPPKARARQVADAADLITGPQGDSRIGDFLLENAMARFVVQNAPQRDLTGIGQFGGNLIDAELVGHPGQDHFMEIQPMLNIETVVNAESVEVVNDGQDGTAAIVRSCGPDDLIDYINANTLVDDLVGLPAFPRSANDVDQNVEACTDYILEPGNAYVEMTTTVINLGATDVGMFHGDFMNGSGELEQWTREGPIQNPPGVVSAIGEMTASISLDLFSYFGFGAGAGVDYAYIPINLPGGGAASSFTQTGVSAVLHSQSVIAVLFAGAEPVFVVPGTSSMDPNENSFTRFFGVGDGSPSNAVDLQLALSGLDVGTLRGCVTVGGSAAPNARVTAGLLHGGQIENVRTIFTMDAGGCYEGKLPPGSYGVAGGRKGTPYEGGGTTPMVHEVTIMSGVETLQDIALPATGRVRVEVSDENGDPIPARIGVVGTDPSPELRFPGSLFGLDLTTALHHDDTQDEIPGGLAWVAYADANGVAEFDLEPGTYDVAVSRGTEYSSYVETVTVAAAPAPAEQVEAQIAYVVETPGFISSDFHVHMLPSSDSGISMERRVRSFAGEGVHNIVATDHDRHTDLNPTIRDLGLDHLVHATVGEEITTFDYGHFNAYPLGLDPDRITQGSTDWAGPTAIGEGFPSSSPPAFALTPEQIFHEVFDTRRVAGGLLNTSPELAIQINHIDSHFEPLKIDTSLTPPRSQMTAADKTERRFDPATPELFFAFPALEVWNGYTRNHQLNEFLGGRIGIWANHLNQGLKTTAIYDTDTHSFFTTRSGGARTWTPASSDAPSAIVDDEVGAAVKTGRAVGGQGIYPQIRLFATNDPGNEANFELGGQTQITVLDGMVALEIRLQAPTWAEYDTIEIYRNPATEVTGCNGTTPVFFTALPQAGDVLFEPNGDFTVDTVNVHPGVPGGERLETTVQRQFTLSQDTWLAIVARGTDGNSASMFPEMPASLSQGGVLAMGATNALYVDVDGNQLFDPPGVNCTNCDTFCLP